VLNLPPPTTPLLPPPFFLQKGRGYHFSPPAFLPDRHSYLLLAPFPYPCIIYNSSPLVVPRLKGKQSITIFSLALSSFPPTERIYQDLTLLSLSPPPSLKTLPGTNVLFFFFSPFSFPPSSSKLYPPQTAPRPFSKIRIKLGKPLPFSSLFSFREMPIIITFFFFPKKFPSLKKVEFFPPPMQKQGTIPLFF